MKVLHVETGRHLYGGALQVRYLLEGLHGQGVENLLAAPQGSEIARAAAPYARVFEVPVQGDLDPRLLLRLIQILRSEKPGVLHVHSRRGADLWGGIASRLTGVPAIVTRRVDNPEPPWLARKKYGLYRQVVSISEGIRQVLLSEGIPAEKMQVIPSAVDTRVYRPGGDREWFRSEFALRPEEKAVAVIAQLIPRKGHRFLIEAAPAILDRCPKVRFLFFGKGPLRQELEDLCRTRGIGEKVLFADFRDDLHRVLPCLDLVVHPALMEGLGVSLLQASACGIPIVAGRAGGIPEVVRDGENGFLVEPGDRQALIDPILRILRDPALATSLGERGKEIVYKDFSIPAMVSGYLRLYPVLSKQ